MLPKNPDISGRERTTGRRGWDREVGDLGGIPSDFQTLPSAVFSVLPIPPGIPAFAANVLKPPLP